MKDLVVLVADADAEWAVRTLCARRAASLGVTPFSFDVWRHYQRDPGVLRQASSFLRPYVGQYRFALVVFDREGCGQECFSPDELERRLEEELERNGWKGRCAVIVLDPELEAWVWGSSPHTAEVLGVDRDSLRAILEGFARNEAGKPVRPKEAMERVLRRSGRPRSPAIYRELAERATVQRCTDRAFVRFRQVLREWFGRRETVEGAEAGGLCDAG